MDTYIKTGAHLEPLDPAWLGGVSWDELAAAMRPERELRERKYRKVFYENNERVKEAMRASSDFISKLFGVPSVVDQIEVERDCLDYGLMSRQTVKLTVSSPSLLSMLSKTLVMKPTKVICNDPATIVFFSDDTKVVTKAHDGDAYGWLTGIAFCCLRKALRNRNFDLYEKPIRKLLNKAYYRDPNGVGDELRAIAKALTMTADALEVTDAD